MADHTRSKASLRSILRAYVPMLFVLVLALYALGAVGPTTAPFHSAEVAFTDSSAHGLAIVPASCPSYPHYSGDCSTLPSGCGPGTLNDQCTPGTPHGCGAGTLNDQCTGCSGSSCTGAPTTCPDGSSIPASGVCTTGSVGRCVATVSCTNSTTVHYLDTSCHSSDVACPANWSCSVGACVPPPSPSVQSFSATYNNNTAFTATGHLEAHPTLVRSGSTTQLYWRVSNTQSCTLTDDASHSWSGSSSPVSGQTSAPLTTKTTYTLSCPPMPGASGYFLESVKVNVVPTFQEL